MSRSWLIYTAAAIVVAGAFWWALRPQPTPVDLATIGPGTVEVTVTEEGVTRVREIYTVSAPVAGRLMRTESDPGDKVTAGVTPVAVIRPQTPSMLDTRTRAELEANVQAAEAALGLAEAEGVRARAHFNYWQGQLRRDEMLVERAAIPAIELEQTVLELETRMAAMESAQALIQVRERELDRARAALIEPNTEGESVGGCCLSVVAPVSGRVLTVIVESEQVIAAGAPLLTIGDTSDLEITADLLSADAVRVKPGDRAIIERWGGGETLDAIVRTIEPAGFTDVSALGIEEQRVRVVLDLDGPEAAWQGLGHAFRVFVRIAIQREDATAVIPMSALFRSGRTWAAFVVEDGLARLTHLEVGTRNEAEATVLSGLDAGDVVIMHPGDTIQDGGRVVDRSAQGAD